MNIAAKVSIGHGKIDGIYQDGQFELIDQEDGTYLVQVIRGQWRATAVINKERFEAELMHDQGFEWIGSVGGVDLYGPKEPLTPSEDEPGVFIAFEKTPTPIKVTTYKSEKYTAEINGIVTEGQLKQAELYLEMCPEGNQSKIIDTEGNILAILRRK